MNRIFRKLAALTVGLAMGGSVKATTVPEGWLTDFDQATNRAFAVKQPLVLVWANESCPECEKLELSLATDEFKTWQAAHPDYLYCFVAGNTRTDKADSMSTRAKEFAQFNARYPIPVKNTSDWKKLRLTAYPFVCLWWPQKDGTVSTAHFTGRTGGMLVARSPKMNEKKLAAHDPAMLALLAQEFAGSVEQRFGSYVADVYAGGTFRDGTTGVTNSLEIALASDGRALTTNMAFRLVRSARTAFTNVLTFAGAEVDVVWATNETAKTVSRPTPATGTAGATLVATLHDKGDVNRAVRSTATVVCARRATSISYPLFVGERTADELDWGEWTMDLDVAKAKAASADGAAYTLVNVGGDLWCPNCAEIAESLYADAAFDAWARAKRVALVSIDQPRFGTRQASLLTYEPSAKNVSGAFYRSAKMIGDAAAEAVFARNERFSHHDYLLPATGAARISNPTVLIFDKSGAVVGRLNPRRDESGLFPTAENLARLDELLRAADAGTAGETRKDASTTMLRLDEGTPASLALSVSDNAAFLRLDGLKVGRSAFTATAAGAASEPVTLELFTTTNGTWAGRHLLASGTGSLAYDADMAVSGAYLRVSAYADARGRDCATAGDTSFDITLARTFEARPGTVAFSSAAQSWMETAGTGIVSVVRAGGVSGRAAVRVVVDTEATTATNRFAFTSADLVWNEGEAGEKSFAVKLVPNPAFEGRQHLVLRLEPLDGNAAALGEPSVQSNEIFDTEDPVFDAMAYDFTFYTGFTTEIRLPLHNVREGRGVSLKRLSGRLPAGVSLRYDKKATNVVLRAAATRTGTGEAAYAVSERRKEGRRTTTATGPETSFSVRVIDPKTASGSDGKPINGFVSTAYRAFTLPVHAQDEVGATVLAGTLKLSVSARNAIAAKFTGWSGKAVSFRGTWSGLDATTGEARSKLVARTGARLSLALSREGVFAGTLTDADAAFDGPLTLVAASAPDAARLAAYAGTYTVTLRRAPGSTNLCQRSTGTGFLTLNAAARSFAKSGTVSFAGLTPDGQPLSGSASLVPDTYEDAATGQRYGLLPILRRTADGVFAAELIVRAGGWAEIDANPYDRNVNPQIVLAAPDVRPVGADACYGGAYSAAHDLRRILVGKQGFEEGETPVFALAFGAEAAELAPSELHGAIAELPEATVSVDARGRLAVENEGDLKATVKLTARTGLLTGSVPIRFADGRTAKGVFRGVLLPGWHDCMCGYDYEPIELPFASGLVTFTDRLDGKSVKRTFSVDLIRP